MEQARSPVNLFYSYAREDEVLRNELEKHLSLLQRRGLITTWHDRKIEPGKDWSHTIDQHLNESSIILLLITPNYLASDYCYNVEMQRALERHEKREAQVIPILLSPVDWHEAPFARLLCLPRDDKFVTEWDNQEAAFRHIAEELRCTIEKQRQIEADNRTKYLDYLMERYRTVTLPFGPVEGFALQAIFQPLTLRRDPQAAEDLQREKRRALLGETLPNKEDNHDEPVVVASTSQDALQKSPQKRMVILGGPGTGKSTVLQFLIAEQTQAACNDAAALLPIMVSLPDLSRSGKTLGEYLLRLTREAGVSDQFAVILKKAIEEGQAFLCLDSLDEVSPDQRPTMIRIINELTSSTGNTWVIGSRFTEYKGGQFRRGQFTEWELQAMSPSLRQELARRLLPELYHLLKPPLDMVEEAPLAFVRLLEVHTQAVAWCENPLLFSLAAIVFVRLDTLPTSRAALYQQVVDAVLETREKDRLRRKVLYRVLSDLALGLYTAKGRTFSLDDLFDVLQDIRQRQHESWEIDELAQRLITSGMFDVLAHETYGFRHQTFQEYLAAVELARRLVSQDQAQRDDTWKFVWSKRSYSRWTEVLRLMVGALTQRHRRAGAQKAVDWLSELAGQQHEPEGDPGLLGLALALKSLAEVEGTTTPYWKEVGGSRVEEALVATWVVKLLDASHQGNTTQQRQLRDLCTDLVHLEPMIAKVALERTRADLHDEDARIRRAAIHALGSLGVCVPAEPLIAGLQDKEWSVRAAAAETLGVLYEKMPVQPLLIALHDQHEEVRAAAIESLGNLGEDTPLEPLLAALNDPAWNVRRAVVEALGKPEAPVSLEQLITIMQDEDPTVRVTVVKSLGKMGEHAPLESLLVALSDQDGEVRSAAAEALGNFGEQMPIAPLLEALDDEEGRACHAAAKSLIKQIRRVPIEPVLALMNKKSIDTYGNDKYEGVRSAGLEILASMGERAPFDILLSALHDESNWIREAAIRALGKLKTATASDAILAMLNDAHELPSIRAAAVAALTNLEEYTFTGILLAALDDPVEAVREAAARHLGQIKNNVLVEQLLTAASQHMKWIRPTAVSVLGKLEGKAPIKLLLFLINDKNEVLAVRIAAVQAIIGLGEYVPIKTTLAVFQHEDSRIRQTVEQIFIRHRIHPSGDISVVSCLIALKHENEKVREAARWELVETEEARRSHARTQSSEDRGLPNVAAWLRACEKSRTPISSELIEMLVELLGDEDVWVCTIAARALGELGAYIPVELMSKLQAALYDQTSQMFMGAIRTFIELGSYAPQNWLRESLDHEDWRIRSTAIALMGESGLIFVRPLLAALNDPQPEVRLVAAQVLGEMEELPPPEPLLAALHDEHMPVRLAVASKLKTLAIPFSSEPVVKALHHPDIAVRLEALRLLAELGEPIPAELLSTAINNNDPAVRYQGARILVSLRERVPLELLRLALQDGDESVRRAAARVLLGELGEHIPMELLQEALQSKHQEVRTTAIHSLVTRGGQTSWELLLALLNEEDEFVSWSARFALSNLAEDIPTKILEDAFNTGTTKVREGIAYVLGKRGKKASMTLLFKVMDDSALLVRHSAMLGLAEAGTDEAAELLAEALQHGSPRIRQTAGVTLEYMKEHIPVTLLLIALKDKDSEVRQRAAKAAAYHVEQVPIIEALLECLQSETNNFVLQHIVEVLGKMSLGEQVPLEPVLDLFDREFLIMTETSGRRLGEQVPLEPMLDLFDTEPLHTDPLRTAVIKALGQFGARAPAELLIATLGDSEQQVREAAGEALKKTHPEALLAIAPEAISILQGQKPGAVFGSVAHSFFADATMNMEDASPALFEQLTQLLDWPYWQVRVKTIGVFGKLRRNIPDAAIQRLLQLRYDPQSPAVRRAADKALAEILSLETGIEDD